ncbi:MAG: pilus assembly protein [Alphaproteobacteria bacterium]|nr:pilus assembly protein [Alphaproteobacteria bacterium]
MTKSFRNWRRETGGATAIEFSIVAIPFTFAIIAVIEVALAYTTGFLLEGGTGAASRMIRTCELQDAADAEADFRAALCSHAVTIPNCQDNVFVETVAMPDDSFMSVSSYEPLFDEDGGMVSRGFATGGVSDVVLVRTGYYYTFLTPVLGTAIGGPDARVLFMSTNVLQVEPCDFEGQT